MNKVGLNAEIERFVGKYFYFKKVKSPKNEYLVIEGKIDIVDGADRYWDQFEVLILINKNEYPYTIPTVFEKTQKINRDWDFHISKKGECCLDIPHKLQKMKLRGIIFQEFYSEVIYPFFANFCYKESQGNYANGEYKHHIAGIAQFYKEEFNLENIELIMALIETSINPVKYPPNQKCPFCGKPKYKNCCRKIIYQLRGYGREQLQLDLKLFNNHLHTGNSQLLTEY